MTDANPLRLAAPLLLLLGACASGPTPKQAKTAEIHHDLAVEALKAGRSQEALKEYDTALAADPEMPEALLGRGLVYEYGFSKLALAEADYRHALQVRPGYPEAHNNLGQLLARTGRTNEALAEFDKAIDINFYMEPWVARCNKGQTLFQMGRKEEGLAELRTCLRIAPRYCPGRRELGRLLVADGKATEAMPELEAYAKNCPKTPDAQLQIGLAKLKLGDAAGARAAFEKCEALAGDGPEADECRKTAQLLK
jgi:type IV pilus biogenesis/stability protein PilW